jgi:hypothetical protein
MKMKRKQQFMQAVQILAPGDQFIHQVAQGIPEEKLPAFPGGAALEFVVAAQKLREPVNDIHIKTSSGQSQSCCNQPASPEKALSLSHSLQIKSAEYWLRLGEPDQALRELERLPARSWGHGWALKTRIAAMGALRQRNEVTVQE